MFNNRQRRWQADKLGDLANLILAALVIGQLTAQKFNVIFGAVTLAIILGTWLYIYYILKH